MLFRSGLRQVRLLSGVNCARDAEVGNLHHARRTDEDVRRLHVAVHVTLGMDVVQHVRHGDKPMPQERRGRGHGLPCLRRPPRGKIGILFGAWHTQPIVDRVYGRIGKAELTEATAEIVRFEKMLTDEGALILNTTTGTPLQTPNITRLAWPAYCFFICTTAIR